MRANLRKGFSERGEERRRKAIQELYAADAVFHESHASFRGHAAICDAVGRLLARLPTDLTFSPDGPAIGHNNMGSLKWRGGPISGSPMITGMDVAQFERGRISSLHVFLDRLDS